MKSGTTLVPDSFAVGGKEMAKLTGEMLKRSRKARKIYNERIRSVVEPEHIGKHLLLELESGDYEVDSSSIAALQRLRARHPDVIFFGMRVGYTTAGAWGTGLKRSEPL